MKIFRKVPDQEELIGIHQYVRTHTLNKRIYHFIRYILKTVISIKYDLKYINVHKFENHSIVCANHSSMWDGFILGSAFPEQLNFMGMAEIFHFKTLKTIFTYIGAFPVRRGMKDKDAIETASYLLHQGNNLMIFPEGKINKEPGKGKVGLGMFALETKANIQPFCIKIQNKGFRKTCYIVKLKPYAYNDYKDLTAQEISDQIMSDITKEFYKK